LILLFPNFAAQPYCRLVFHANSHLFLVKKNSDACLHLQKQIDVPRIPADQDGPALGGHQKQQRIVQELAARNRGAPGVVLSLVKELLDCITGDGKPRVSTAHANTVTIKATATKRKTHVA
jgi:hypothetical protein